ncbi:unnamed protein product, partial [Coccothraustes coccothraustes]
LIQCSLHLMLRTHPERMLRPLWYTFSIQVEIFIMQFPIMTFFQEKLKGNPGFV